MPGRDGTGPLGEGPVTGGNRGMRSAGGRGRMRGPLSAGSSGQKKAVKKCRRGKDRNNT